MANGAVGGTDRLLEGQWNLRTGRNLWKAVQKECLHAAVEAVVVLVHEHVG